MTDQQPRRARGWTIFAIGLILWIIALANPGPLTFAGAFIVVATGTTIVISERRSRHDETS